MADTSKLTDLLDFMTQLKDFNFQTAASKCCAEAVTAVKKCVLDRCWTWTDYTMILSSLKVAYDQDLLGPLVIAAAGALEVYVGMKGGADTWANALPTWFNAMGAVVGMVVGSLAGGYIGIKTIEASVRTSFWDVDSLGVTNYSSSYLIYGGHSVIGGLMGLFSVFWVVAWLMLALTIVSAPFYLTMYLQKYMQDHNEVGDQLNDGYRHLTNGVVIGVASWGAAIALTQSAERLIGFFDKQSMAVNTDDKSQTALTIDVVNHSIILTFYYLFAWTIAGSGYAYVYYQLNPEEVPAMYQ